MAGPDQVPFELSGAGGVPLRGWTQGEGPEIVLLHGITAHRDLVVHGSSHLPRKGFRLISYDARAHGESEGGETGTYAYETLRQDLEAVCGELCEGKPVLCGHSMGCHTLLAAALQRPDAYAGMVAIGPASRGEPISERSEAEWDRLADGLEEGGVEGWLEAYEANGLNPEWKDTLLRIARARIEKHQHPQALAQALREVPRSVPFDGLDSLAAIELPTLVIGSRDEADPGHPLAAAQDVAARIGGSEFVCEDEGESPLAWQGGALSRRIEEFCRGIGHG